MTRKVLIHALVATCIFAIPALSNAQTDALDISALGTVGTTGVGYSLGWQFQTGSNAVNVTALGYFDQGAIGNMGEDHEVGIYDAGGNLLCSADVNAGVNPLTQANFFAYTSNLAGTTLLNANSTYYVTGASGFSDPYEYGGSHVTGSDITFIGDAWEYGNALSFPDLNEGESDGFYGGNFQYQAVPEPMPLIGLGLGVLGLVVRRKRK